MKLPMILFLMALVLGAGVLSVQQLESRVGATTVPGVIVLDLPSLAMTDAQDLARAHQGSTMAWITAGEQPLSPFDLAPTRRRTERGEATVVFDPAGAGADGEGTSAWRQGWSVVLTEFPERDPVGRAERAVARAADFVAAQDGTRPFRLGLALGAEPRIPIDDLLVQIEKAADGLPSFRRTAIVVLGERLDATRRLFVRIDRGRWDHRALPLLADLLEDDA
ncbi:MAG: hypothetical protein ACYTCU_00110 [Planctomycetota bacterium]|jgi:hypothetical protein